LGLVYNGVSTEISAAQVFLKVNDGLLRSTITLPALSITPSGNKRGSLQVILESTVDDEKVKTVPALMKLPNNKNVIAPLFETRNRHNTPASRRYQSSNADPRQDPIGGDGWGRVAMLDFLHNTGEGGTLLFNDISGEHARQSNGKSLGVHKEHKDGLDVDARYRDENNANATAMRGDGNGANIKETLDNALDELLFAPPDAAKPNLDKIRGWIKHNREFLEEIASTPGVKKVLVGVASWHQNLLIGGAFPGGSPIPSDQKDEDEKSIPVGQWISKPEKVHPKPGNHEGHIHVSFD